MNSARKLIAPALLFAGVAAGSIGCTTPPQAPTTQAPAECLVILIAQNPTGHDVVNVQGLANGTTATGTVDVVRDGHGGPDFPWHASDVAIVRAYTSGVTNVRLSWDGTTQDIVADSHGCQQAAEAPVHAF